jgi:hypothetical protein
MSAMTAVFLALFGLYRITRRGPPALEEQAEFVAMVRTSPVALEMHPEVDQTTESDLTEQQRK